jgi:hypothetical protein
VDQQALLDNIRALMQAPLDRDAAEGRARVERVLTDGYAHALVLEGERLQIERQMSEITAKLQARGGRSLARELSELSKRLSGTDTALVELRTLLASLRDRLRR